MFARSLLQRSRYGPKYDTEVLEAAPQGRNRDSLFPDLSVPKTPCMLKSLHLQSDESPFSHSFVRAHK